MNVQYLDHKKACHDPWSDEKCKWMNLVPAAVHDVVDVWRRSVRSVETSTTGHLLHHLHIRAILKGNLTLWENLPHQHTCTDKPNTHTFRNRNTIKRSMLKRKCFEVEFQSHPSSLPSWPHRMTKRPTCCWTCWNEELQVETIWRETWNPWSWCTDYPTRICRKKHTYKHRMSTPKELSSRLMNSERRTFTWSCQSHTLSQHTSRSPDSSARPAGDTHAI